MKVPFQQTEKYGCGHYALANFFANENYLHHIIPEKGSTIRDLNEALLKEKSPFYLSSLIKLNSGLDYQNRFTDASLFDVEGDNPAELMRPFLINIKGERLHHCLLILQDLHDKEFWIVDSCCKDIFKLTLSDLLANFWIVEIDEFKSPDIVDDNKCVLFYKSNANHLIYAPTT